VVTAQPNLVEGREFFAPQSVAIDRSNTPSPIYVSDTGNNRVLAWRNSQDFQSGATADLVIGQRDLFTTTRGGPGTTSSTGLFSPTSLAVDSRGNLYILDSGNSRLLRFPSPFQQSEQFPNLVIGQTSFNCATCNQPNSDGLSAKSIASSATVVYGGALAFDSAENLWIADTFNHRVLRYPASLLGDDARNAPAADLVLGQVDFLTNTTPEANATNQRNKNVLRFPGGLAFDSAGRLYVTDTLNRMLVWETQVFSGQPANRIAGIYDPPEGQTVPPVNDQLLAGPEGVFVVDNSPGVVDARNNRLVIFDPYEQWPPETTSFSPKGRNRGPVGQPDYNRRDINRALAEPNGASLNNPTTAVVSEGELFVVDSRNHRVLVFPASNLGPGASATRVLGQLALEYDSVNLIEGREFAFSVATTQGLVADGGVVVDWNGETPHLYIADTFNHRILGFRDARRIRPGDRADLVIGQPDLYRSVINYPSGNADQPNDTGLYQPSALALDADGNLYVADSANGRVLRFPKPFEGDNLPKANLVLGQGSFFTKITDPTATRMASPSGLAFAGVNGLLVSDTAHNRVLYFSGRPDELRNVMAASLVFGQPNFNSVAAGTGDNQMRTPGQIATDTDDRLYVADTGNNRVLIFNRAPLAGSDPRAGAILTQVAQGQNLQAPRGVYVNRNTGEIWVAEATTTRVLRYPRFDDLIANQSTANYTLNSVSGSVSITQDKFGNVYYADLSNRIAVHFPALNAINGANFLTTRALAPFTIASLYGQGLPFATGNTSAPSVPLPTRLADIEVTVAGTLAPLYFVGERQINMLVPSNAPTSGVAEVEITKVSTGQVLASGPVPMAPVSPGLFTADGTGNGALAALNEDGSVNSPTNPIGRGKVIVLFGTGMGVIPGAPPDGQAPTGPVNAPFPPRVVINNFVPDDHIIYAGLAPGLPGVWQLNIRVPQAVPVLTPTGAPIATGVLVGTVPSNDINQNQRHLIYVKEQ